MAWVSLFGLFFVSLTVGWLTYITYIINDTHERIKKHPCPRGRFSRSYRRWRIKGEPWKS